MPHNSEVAVKPVMAIWKIFFLPNWPVSQPVGSVAIADATLPGGVPFQHAAATKVLATQTAFEIAHDAIQTLGGNGLTHEYLAEKLFRDARASLIEDGENSMLGLMAASRL